jgi:hypothetical protein
MNKYLMTGESNEGTSDASNNVGMVMGYVREDSINKLRTTH